MKKSLMPVFIVTSVLNFVLFSVKLYIGLSANSISIYSDGINNLFDSLSCIAAIVCFSLLRKSRDRFSSVLAERTEMLLSLVLSCVIFAVGAVFLYNSAERLMYPTPVWFALNYFYILLFTAAVKLVMFFFLKNRAKRLKSEIVRLMSVDSMTDFFVTAVTVFTLFISQSGSYSFDAFGGIVISIFVIVTAIKNLKQNVLALIGLPEKEKRIKIEQILDESGIGEGCEIDFSLASEKRAYLKITREFHQESLEAFKEKVYNETGIRLYIIKKEEI